MVRNRATKARPRSRHETHKHTTARSPPQSGNLMRSGAEHLRSGRRPRRPRAPVLALLTEGKAEARQTQLYTARQSDQTADASWNVYPEKGARNGQRHVGRNRHADDSDEAFPYSDVGPLILLASARWSPMRATYNYRVWTHQHQLKKSRKADSLAKQNDLPHSAKPPGRRLWWRVHPLPGEYHPIQGRLPSRYGVCVYS